MKRPLQDWDERVCGGEVRLFGGSALRPLSCAFCVFGDGIWTQDSAKVQDSSSTLILFFFSVSSVLPLPASRFLLSTSTCSRLRFPYS